LSAFEDRFLRFGGHAQAIGLSIAAKDLEDVNRSLQEAAESWDPEVLAPSYEYEEHLEASVVDLELVRELERLEPFGMANRRPLFRIGPLSLVDAPRAFGKNHLGLRARDRSGTPVQLVAWRWAERAALFSEPFEVLGHVKLDSYLGRASIEIADARPAAV
jgi:single-stranded-DNA-specific exonuclease